MTRRVFFSALICGFMVCCGLSFAGEKKVKKNVDTPTRLKALTRQFVRDFGEKDNTREQWKTDKGEKLGLVRIDEDHGDSLEIPVNFPEATQVWRGGRDNPVRLVKYRRDYSRPALILRRLRYDLFVPSDIPEGTRVQSRLLLKNKDGFWFEALGTRKAGTTASGETKWTAAEALYPGWNTILVDLSESSLEFRPRGHQMKWSRLFLSQVVAVGVSVQADGKYEGKFALDNITTWPSNDSAAYPAPNMFREKLAFGRFSAPQKVKRYGMAEISFDINRPLLSPFRQKEIKIDAIFKAPDGKVITVPAFYYQEYERIKGSDKPGTEFDDKYVPVGAGLFKVRFTPRQAGDYSYRLHGVYVSPVSEKKEEVVTGEKSLHVEAGEGRGFVRISKKDATQFEFENGDYFFPLGHSFRSPNDPRHVNRILKRYYRKEPVPKNRGLRAYEDLIPRMKNSGVNSFEVWMCSWWLGLEWTGAWRGYHGLGSYNLENAWKLDYVIKLAEDNGQYVHLVIDNHGKAAQKIANPKNPRHKGQCDHEWEFSPYSSDNAADGGFLKLAKDLFSNPTAKEYYRDKLRYIVARYGWSRHIYGIEMWSELSLIGHVYGRHRWLYASAQVRKWHQEMTDYIRSLDHGNHILTTHYDGHYAYVDQGMVSKPYIDYVVCDAYHSPKMPLVDMLRKTEVFCDKFKKPFMVTEYGGDWNASSIEGLTGDLYGGLWWGWMSRTSGVPFYWWFEFVALEDHYKAYRALANFVKGEDKRRGKDEPQLKTDWPVELSSADQRHNVFDSLVLADGKVFYAWVFHKQSITLLPRSDKQWPRVGDIAFTAKNVPAGAYAVEVWDSWKGKIISKKTSRPDGEGNLKVELPPFIVHIALKIKRIGG